MSQPTVSQLKKLVNDTLSMTDLLKKYNPYGSYVAGQPCFCPFHDNTRSPSAAIYNNDGVELLFCFSEQRQYRPTDVIEILLKKDIYQIGNKIWNSLSELEKNTFLKENITLEDSFSTETHKKDMNKYSKYVKAFKYGEIKVHRLLKEYLDWVYYNNS